MFLCDTAIKESRRELIGKLIHTCSLRHSGTDSDNILVLYCDFEHCPCESRRICELTGLSYSGLTIERTDAVIAGWFILRERIALTLLRTYVKEYRMS